MKKSKVCIFVDRRYAAAKLDKKVQQDYVLINAYRKQKDKNIQTSGFKCYHKDERGKIEKSVL